MKFDLIAVANSGEIEWEDYYVKNLITNDIFI